MSRRLLLTSWTDEVSARFPDFPAPVAAVLALYSFGVVLTHASGLATVVLFLADHLATARHALR